MLHNPNMVTEKHTTDKIFFIIVSFYNKLLVTIFGIKVRVMMRGSVVYGALG